MSDRWVERNQKYLTAQLARVRGLLEQRTGSAPDAARERAAEVARRADEMLPARPALEVLCATFDLSPFERDVLLLCAAVELDSSFAALCAEAQGDPHKNYATFSLALAVLPDAHWSALTPAAPLRRWRLVELGAGTALTTSPLRIHEHVLHYLVGAPHLDEQLAGWVEPVRAAEDALQLALVPSQRARAERIIEVWPGGERGARLPVIQLVGADHAGKRWVANAACAALGLQLYALDARVLPTDARELENLQRLWEREAALNGCALLLDAHDLDEVDALRSHALARWLEQTRGAIVLAAKTHRPMANRASVMLEVDKPTVSEQQALWRHAVGERAAQLDGALDALAAQFNLDAEAIQAAADAAGRTGRIHSSRSHALWDAARIQARPRLDDLAQRIEPRATWDDIVLPPPQLALLHEMAAQARQRHRVYETWGWGERQTRGLGISALFSGASGTGKTMAGEVLANELRLDLYRIDLSAVVSKYIGETERNLRRVFDAAEQGGAILLFDEADALFGKRSEVKDSHDRYANIEVSYLLQRMEAYRGLAILTTNMQEALDKAFLRRIRFIVPFPFPDAAQRAEIWKRIFPPQTPTAPLDMARLARLNITGGSIRNIALNASFLAADANEPVNLKHLLRAAQVEYDKLGKTLTEVEIGGWGVKVEG